MVWWRHAYALEDLGGHKKITTVSYYFFRARAIAFKKSMGNKVSVFIANDRIKSISDE